MPTVAEYLETWLNEDVALTRRPNTARAYTNAVRTHIIPGLGSETLEGLNPLRVRSFFASLKTAGKSPRLMHLVYSTLRAAFSAAERNGEIPTSPVRIRPPRLPKKKPVVLDSVGVGRLLAAAKNDPLEVLWWLAISSGLRRGEVLGLHWEDVAADCSYVHVQGNLVEPLGRPAERGEPKSAAGLRRVYLPETAAARMKAWRTITGGVGGRPVFAASDGGYMRSTTLHRAFKRLLGKAGLPNMKFHGLRHSVATLLLSRGEPIQVVQEILGHHSPKLTLETYAHVLPGAGRSAARTMEGVVGVGAC